MEKTKRCEECGKKFTTVYTHKIFCGDECRNLSRKSLKAKQTGSGDRSKYEGPSAAEIGKYAWDNYRMSYGQYVAWKGL